jgi:hypothetical protein
MLQYRTALTAYMIVARIAITLRRRFVAASLFGPLTGGRFARVQASHTAMATSTTSRRSVRRRTSAAAIPGRISTKAEPTAKIALPRA